MKLLKTGKKFYFIFFPMFLLLWLLLKLGDFGINFFRFLLNLLRDFFNFKPKLFFSARLTPPVNMQLSKKTKQRRKRSFKIFRFFSVILSKRIRLAIISIFLGISFAAYSYFLVLIAHDLPSPNNLRNLPTPTTTEFYDRNGKLLYRFYEGKNRTPVKLSEIPKSLIYATIAMEDKNFYSHFGVDFFGIARAGLSLMQNGEVQGGSTITQQLIKNTLLTPERTLQRKFKEIVLAFWAERIFSKDEILEMYFNEVPYGGATWGIAAASQTYFGKKVSDLNLAESSYLAGLPASPTTYSPYGTNPDLAKSRQAQALRRMTEDGFINRETSDKIFNEPLDIKPPATEIKAPHFVMYVRSRLAEKYGERFVSQGGLKVITSLDLNLQEKTEAIVFEEVEKIKNLKATNGAALITDAKTGQILAMAGSKNYWDTSGGNFNVTTALRQPGSSIKPITYAAAFKLGYAPGNTLLDTPISFKNFWETYTPVNYDGKFRGPVTVRTALASSLNIPAVKLLSLVGLPEMLKTARDLGITTLNDTNRYGLSLTLGGGEIKMIDMMAVYGTFSQMGKKNTLKEVLKITDTKGNLIEDNTESEGETVLQPAVAYLITDILSDNKARTPVFGSNSLLNIPGHQVAVKTGTTDNKRDNWTFGYTPDFVVGVWVGNNDNSPMDARLTSGVTGAAPIWNRIMTEILKNREPIAFQRPEDVITGTVDGHKDLAVAGLPVKTAIGFNKPKVKDDKSAGGKEVITYTDPFSTYQSDQSGQPILINP